MDEMRKIYYGKRGRLLVKNLRSRHFEAWYCDNKEEALAKALSLIPLGATVGWGGSVTCQQIGLLDAVRAGEYIAFDREATSTPFDREMMLHRCLNVNTFLTSANAMSMDGEMVNIDGTGNRLAAICFGPEQVVVVVGMNKVVDTLDDAIRRARTVAAPINKQRFDKFATPCGIYGTCADCKSEQCICNQILITRHGRGNRIKFVIVGEELGY